MTHLISGTRIKPYCAHQDGQPIDHWHARKRFSHVLALFLALAVIAVASPAQELRLRSEARARISELERLRKLRGENDPVFKKKLERAQIDFGVRSRSLSTPSHPLSTRLVLEDLKSNLSAKYRLLDASGEALYWGDDQGELARKLNEFLSDDARRSIYVEMKGFSVDKAEALASSLRIQQHQIDPAVSIDVLPHFEENLAPHQDLFTRGIRLEGEWTPPERIDSGKDAGKFRTDRPVAHGFGHFTITIIGATLELLQELREILQNLLSTEILQNLHPTWRFDEGQSLSQLVDGTRQEMMKRHRGLTDQQFRIEVIDQFGSIRIGELNRSVLFAWS